jgi:UPF0042 nucleotide-binding protein
MRFVIVTGMSGAGKSTVLKMLEDVGYFCVDNIPIPLLGTFTELAAMSETEYSKVALGVDIRSGKEIEGLQAALERMSANGIYYEILYLEASDMTLVRRYKETRRSHPLARDGRVEDGIAEERSRMAFLKKQADYIMDTSTMLVRDLRAEVEKIFVNSLEYNNIHITILSFGFKYGIPEDSDLVFDVRFLPNPYYIDDLKLKTGQDAPVRDYVLGFDVTGEFLKKLEDMVEFLLPNYVAEGKNQLVISIGCTGGRHRSVTLAESLYQYLEGKSGYGLKLVHRDIAK